MIENWLGKMYIESTVMSKSRNIALIQDHLKGHSLILASSVHDIYIISLIQQKCSF